MLLPHPISPVAWRLRSIYGAVGVALCTDSGSDNRGARSRRTRGQEVRAGPNTDKVLFMRYFDGVACASVFT